MKLFLYWPVPVVIASWSILKLSGRGFLIYSIGAFFVLLVMVALLLYYGADRILVRWYHAKEVRDKTSPLTELVRRGAQQAGIPVPRVFLVDSAMPNAFATGRKPDHASIVVTNGLLEVLSPEELEAVLMHGLVQIKTGDLFRVSLVAIVSGLLTGLATVAFWCSIFTGFGQEDDPAPNLIKFFVTSLVAPIAALLIQLMITPARIFRADEESVRLTGKPDTLVRALEKLEQRLSSARYEVNPAHVHLFFINPHHDEEVVVMDFHLPTYHFLFRTHPGVGARIAALQALQGKETAKGG